MTFQVTITTKAALISASLFALCAALVLPLARTFADGETAAGSRAALGTGFTLQGRFEEDGVPANGTFPFRFTLHSDAAANSPVGSPISKSVAVTDGEFSTVLDFGGSAFDGNARWIAVEVDGGSGFVALPPRQALTATPYALYSLTTGPHSHAGADWEAFLPTTLTIRNHNSAGVGLYAASDGDNSSAVQARNFCQSFTGFCYGLYAEVPIQPSDSTKGGVGVRAIGTHAGLMASGDEYGVTARSLNGEGVRGESTSSTGVVGIGLRGVWGEGASAGVYGFATGVGGKGVEGVASNGIGVRAVSYSGTGLSANGTDWAGDFTGNIRVSSTVRADDVLPRQETCTSGCYLGDSVKPWTALYAAGAEISGNINVSGSARADDVLPTTATCFSGCYVGDAVKPWTGMYANSFSGTFYGNLYGFVIEPSDSRLKQDITGLPYGLAEILALRPVSYSLIDDETGKTRLGLIAQEVEQVLPEVVAAPASEDAFYAMSYDDLIPVLIKAIQEQQAEIEVLKAALGIE